MLASEQLNQVSLCFLLNVPFESLPPWTCRAVLPITALSDTRAWHWYQFNLISSIEHTTTIIWRAKNGSHPSCILTRCMHMMSCIHGSSEDLCSSYSEMWSFPALTAWVTGPCSSPYLSLVIPALHKASLQGDAGRGSHDLCLFCTRSNWGQV